MDGMGDRSGAAGAAALRRRSSALPLRIPPGSGADRAGRKSVVLRPRGKIGSVLLCGSFLLRKRPLRLRSGRAGLGQLPLRMR